MRGAFEEQPVHLRRQPDAADSDLRQRPPGRRRARRRSHHAAGRAPPARRDRRPVPRSICASGRFTVAAMRPGGAARADRRPGRIGGRPRSAARGAGRGRATRKEIASSRLVLPAPFGPVSTTGRASSIELAAAVVAEIGQREPRQPDDGPGGVPDGSLGADRRRSGALDIGAAVRPASASARRARWRRRCRAPASARPHRPARTARPRPRSAR